MIRVDRRTFGAITLLTAGAMALPGCGKKSSTAKGNVSNEKLSVGATAIPQSMDMLANDGSAIPQVLLYNVYETLVKLDDKGQMHPGLATDWHVSEDGTVYTFNLNPEAKFASGAPVTPDAVIASIEHARSGSKTSPTIRSQMMVISSLKAEGDHKVVITLTRPSNDWLFRMTQSGGIIVEPNHLNDMDAATYGSGPYMLKEWRHNESVELVRNENYWGKDLPYYASVIFKYYVDSNAENSAMLAGDLDIVSNVAAPQALSAFENSNQFDVYNGTSTLEVMLAFNHANKALSNLKVRQAINHAIDRQAFIDSVWGGKGTLIGSMVPPTDPWYEDLSNTYPYDPAKAKALLSEAGYANGLKLRLRVPTLPYATDGAHFITSQLKAVGITLEVDELEFPARWIDVVMSQRDYDMTIIAHAEPRDMVRFADPKYYWNYSNAKVTQLVESADRGNEQQMIADMKQVARIIAEDAAADFLFLMPNLVVAKKGLTNVMVNATIESYDITAVRPA